MSGITEAVKGFIMQRASGAAFMTSDVVEALGRKFESRDVSSILSKLAKRSVLMAEPASVGRGIVYSVPELPVEQTAVAETPEIVEGLETQENEVEVEEEATVVAEAETETSNEDPETEIQSSEETNENLVEGEAGEPETEASAKEVEEVDPVAETEKNADEKYFDEIMKRKYSGTHRVRALALTMKPGVLMTSRDFMERIGADNMNDVSCYVHGLAKRGYLHRKGSRVPGFLYEINMENRQTLWNKEHKVRKIKEKAEKTSEKKDTSAADREAALANAKALYGEDAKEGVEFFVVPSAKTGFSILSAADYHAIFAK